MANEDQDPEQPLLAEVARLRARLALYEAADTSLAERFEQCLEQMLDCFGIFSSLRDAEGHITDFRIDYLNPAACANNQLPLEAQIGKGLCELLPAHRATGLFDRYCEVVETGRPLELESLDYEDRYTRQGRMEREFDLRAWKLGDGFAASWRDITERKRQELALQESEDRFRQIADSIPHLVWTTLPDGYCDFLNRQWAEYTGIPQEEQQGDRWVQALHPDDRERVFAQWLASLEGRATYDVEYRIRRHDGVYRWFKTRAQAIHDEQGRVVRWFGTSTDFDEQRRAEREILEARNAAEAANQAKDHFLAILSHELRTPLMPVLAALQRLEAEPDLRPDLRDRIAMIRRNVALETRLIDDLLDHTRIGRGKLELRPAPVDAHETIRHTLALFEGEAREKNLRLTADLRAGRPWLSADPARLQQILWNLVKNAIKFTPQGGAVLLETADDGEELVVAVRDSGIGIAPEDLGRIFNSFEQGSRDLTRGFGGLGLGLAISKGLVELHGGTLTAESVGVGEGAVFTVRLPALEAPVYAEPAATAPAERLSSGHRVLIVDDHHDTVLAMADLLEMMGYAVGTAGSVAAALRSVEEGPFDVVISDIGLPDGSGLDLMRQLRERSVIRGIALSGFGMEEDQRRSLEAGFTEHLTKPIDLVRLEQALARATSGNI